MCKHTVENGNSFVYESNVHSYCGKTAILNKAKARSWKIAILKKAKGGVWIYVLCICINICETVYW